MNSEISTSPPNVLLIVVDDWGWTDAGFMGSEYYETPNLDVLAKEGMLFTNAYASAANCAPSRASMLSGRNTPWHGVYTVSPSERGDSKTRKIIPVKNTKHLSNEVYTLPKMMKNAGYVTANFGKWHIGEYPKLQGIDHNVGGCEMGNPGKNGYWSPYKIKNISDGVEGEYLTDRLASEAIDFITQHGDTAFFVYLPFYTVHTPILGKEKWVAHYKNKKGNKGHDNPMYAAMISSMDENIGRVIQSLKDQNLYEQTLIILTSDNGGLQKVTKQYPLRAGKGSYYEGGIRVPLVIKWKNHIPENSVNESRVNNLDFYPTLQQIVQPTLEADSLEGVDLTPLFAGSPLQKRTLYFHFPIYLQSTNIIEGLRDPLFRTRPGSVIIDGDWKLHHYLEDNAFELYDLKNDPSEKRNLASSHSKKKEALYEKLEDWRNQSGAAMPTANNLSYDAAYEARKMEEARRKK